MDFFLGLPFFIIVAVLLPWIAGPIAVYFTNEMPALPEFFPLVDDEIESCTSPAFIERSRAMESLGFEQAANLQWITGKSRCFTRLFYRPSTNECSQVSEITSSVGVASGVHHYMEFITEFEDGLEIDTNNSDLSGVLAPVLQKQIHSLPGVEDAATVYKVHRYLTGDIRGQVKPLPARDRIAKMIGMESARTLRRQVEAGYFYLDHSRGTYRPTALGAVLMSWKLVWPAGMIRKGLMRRKASRLVRASAHLAI